MREQNPIRLLIAASLAASACNALVGVDERSYGPHDAGAGSFGGSAGEPFDACVPIVCKPTDCGETADGCGDKIDCGNQGCHLEYENNFENPGDYQVGAGDWFAYPVCNADALWSVGPVTDTAAPGGQRSLKMHTQAFKPACKNAGVYALTPPIPAKPGVTYRAQIWSRNGAAEGYTALGFFDKGNSQIPIPGGLTAWESDVDESKTDPTVIIAAPLGTETLRVGLGLLTASADAYVDLVRVYAEP